MHLKDFDCSSVRAGIYVPSLIAIPGHVGEFACVKRLTKVTVGQPRP